MVERDRQEVLFANDAFYRAFAEGDFEAMYAIWSKGEVGKADVFCLHPGAEILCGAEAVLESWRKVLTAPPPITCLSPVVYCQGDIGVVLCFERIGGAEGQSQPAGYLAATNLFRREDGAWHLFHHQAGPSAGPSDPDVRSQNPVNQKPLLN